MSVASLSPRGDELSLRAARDAESLGPGGDALSRAAALPPSFGAVADCSSGRLSPGDGVDAVAPVPPRHCLWCEAPLGTNIQSRFCCKRCRQTAFRARQLAVAEDLGDTPKRLAVADPPYPGLSRKYYRDEPTYAGEVDLRKLVVSLEYSFDGWALCTSPKALRDVLVLCPPDVRVCAWVKPGGVSSKTRGIHNRWEPVVVRPARQRRPGKVDWIRAQVARGGGETLMGRKPLAWCMWVFGLLGASHVDSLADIYPGTGVVTRCWRQFIEASLTPASATAPGDCDTSQALRLELHDTIGATAELAKRMHRRLTTARLALLVERLCARLIDQASPSLEARSLRARRYQLAKICLWLHREFPEAFA